MEEPVQLALVQAGARCGYCDRELTKQPAGDYACPRCRPLLAEVRTIEGFAQFQRDAARS
jgi:Zn finger protein HypA/HybF involved in hydrogenase expression